MTRRRRGQRLPGNLRVVGHLPIRRHHAHDKHDAGGDQIGERTNLGEVVYRAVPSTAENPESRRQAHRRAAGQGGFRAIGSVICPWSDFGRKGTAELPLQPCVEHRVTQIALPGLRMVAQHPAEPIVLFGRSSPRRLVRPAGSATHRNMQPHRSRSVPRSHFTFYALGKDLTDAEQRHF